MFLLSIILEVNKCVNNKDSKKYNYILEIKGKKKTQTISVILLYIVNIIINHFLIIIYDIFHKKNKNYCAYDKITETYIATQ